MYNFVVILIVIVSFLLIFVVVIQNSKGVGLTSGFSFANQIVGVRRAMDLLEKLTWWLVGILVFLCISVTIFSLSKYSSLEDTFIKKEDILKISSKNNRYSDSFLHVSTETSDE